MTFLFLHLLIWFGAYLVGSIDFTGVFLRYFPVPLSRQKNTVHSKVSNMLDSLGIERTIVIQIMEGIKGFLPVFIARIFGISGFELPLISAATLLGHFYPIYSLVSQFKGGKKMLNNLHNEKINHVVSQVESVLSHQNGEKGTAVALGGLFGLNPILGALSLGTWAIIAALSRHAAFAAIGMVVLAPVYALFVSRPYYSLTLLVVAALIIYKHKDELIKLKKDTQHTLQEVPKKLKSKFKRKTTTAHHTR